MTLGDLGEYPDHRVLKTIKDALAERHNRLHWSKNDEATDRVRERLTLQMLDVEEAQRWVSEL